MIARFIALVGRNLAPNRLAIWVTALANVTGALIGLLSDLGVEQTATLVVALGGLNALCVIFLKGWQQFERAIQQDQLMENELRYQARAVAGVYAPAGANAAPKKAAGQDAAKRLGLSR